MPGEAGQETVECHCIRCKKGFSLRDKLGCWVETVEFEPGIELQQMLDLNPGLVKKLQLNITYKLKKL